MPRILLDGAVLTDRTQVMEQFRQMLALPEHCGNTLDALWDCLTGEPLDAGEPILVQIIHGSTLDERFGQWTAGLRRLLTDAAHTLDNGADRVRQAEIRHLHGFFLLLISIKSQNILYHIFQ